MSVLKRYNGTTWEPVGPEITSTRFDSIDGMIAPEYSPTEIYNVGDYVVQSDRLYKCISIIEEIEEWTPAHWTQVSMGEEVSDLKSALTWIYPTNWFNEAKLKVGQIKLNGEIRPNETSYSYLEKIPVHGNKISFQGHQSGSANKCNIINFVTAYDSLGNPLENKGASSVSDYYTVPEGVKFVSITLYNTRLSLLEKQIIQNNGTLEDYSNYFDPYFLTKTEIENKNKKNYFSELSKGKMIDCIRNVSWINIRGEQLLQNLCDSIGVNGWLDFRENLNLNESGEAIYTNNPERGATDFINVNNYNTITSQFKDGLDFKISYKVFCYDLNKNFLGTCTPNVHFGNVLDTFLENTVYIRLLLLNQNQQYTNIADEYTGRLLHIYFNETTELIYCMTKSVEFKYEL